MSISRKIFIVSALLVFSLAPTAAQSSESCTFQGAAYLAEDGGEPFEDAAERSTMRYGIGGHTTDTDRESKTVSKETFDDSLHAFIYSSASQECGQQVDIDLSLECSQGLECEFRERDAKSVDLEVQTDSIRKIPVKVRSTTTYSGNLTQMTEDERRQITERARRDGLVKLTWDTGAETRSEDRIKRTSTAAFALTNNEPSNISFVESMGYNTLYFSETNGELSKGYKADLDFFDDYIHDFTPYVWSEAYAKPVEADYGELSDYQKVNVYYESEEEGYASPEGWITPENEGRKIVELSSLSEQQEWLIYPASCITGEQSDYYRERADSKFFHLIHTGITSEQWVCGFNKPLYLPSATSDQPPSFEQD